MESFIEISEEVVAHFEDWIYDAILNRTIKELENDDMTDFVGFINNCKRETSDYLSLVELDSVDFKTVARYMRIAFSKSQLRRTGLYSRKAHNKFLKEFKNLNMLIYRDKRYQE